MQTTTTTEKSRIIDKPFDQITQRDKIEAGDTMITLFAYAGKFQDIKLHYDNLCPNARQFITEIVGHSYLAYLKRSEQHKDTSLFFWVEQVEQAYDNAMNDLREMISKNREFDFLHAEDKGFTILGQFSKHIDLFNESLNQQ